MSQLFKMAAPGKFEGKIAKTNTFLKYSQKKKVCKNFFLRFKVIF